MFVKFKFKKPSAPQWPSVSEEVTTFPERPRILTRAFILSVGGNFALAGLFLYALLDPISNVNFIVQVGIWLFIAEFLSIFVSGGAGRRGGRFRFGDIVSNSIGFIVIALFAFVFGFLFLGSIFLPLIFMGSVLVKLFGKKTATDLPPSTMYAIPLLLGSSLIVFLIGPEFWVHFFPFPEDYNQYVPSDWAARQASDEISGEFVDRPQTMLAWGIIYFGIAATINLLYFLKMRKIIPSTNKHADSQ